MTEYVFGANILENLTTGMYQDPKVIYREYIQNACDQIDKAEQLGILRSRDLKSKYPDLGAGVVNIWLSPEDRKITIHDNATGIKAAEFQKKLGSIADSDKIRGEDKGFRGIGRLCGLAYCRQLVFTSRFQGENKVSIMSCDALRMREMINATNVKTHRYTAQDVLNEVLLFSTRTVDAEDEDHFFQVEMFDINVENQELFGDKRTHSIQNLTDYLSFVAPVPYQGNFIYRSEIYAYTKRNGICLDEYNIRINGEQIFKKYKSHLKAGNGDDEIYGIEFHEIKAEDDSLLAWLWFGKTSFKAAIKEEELSRGFRLRKENIQIGNDDTLKNLFSREASQRGNSYFVGEVHAISRDLIPNSQRSYFNSNAEQEMFVNKLKDYFNSSLYHVYYAGSTINSNIRKINTYQETRAAYDKKCNNGTFLSDEESEKEKEALEEKRKVAIKAEQDLQKKAVDTKSPVIQEIAKRRIGEASPLVETTTVRGKSVEPKSKTDKQNTSKKKFLVDAMFPTRNRAERKLLVDILEQVFSIIQSNADKKTAELIIQTIKDELK